MMLYRVILYIAIVSSLMNAVAYTMEMDDPTFNNPNYYIDENGTVHYTPGNEWYNDNITGTNWFSGTNIHPAQDRTIVSQEDFDRLGAENQSLLTEDSAKDIYEASNPSALSFIWSMLKGIAWIKPTLDNVLHIDDGSGNNLFAPFNTLIQIGIWAIYSVGVLQLIRNSNYRYNY